MIDTWQPPVKNDYLHCLAFTPNGKYLILCTRDSIQIWDGGHGRLLQKIRGAASAIAVSPDGRYLALGGSQPDLLGGIPLVDLFVHPDGVGGRVVLYDLHDPK